MKNSIDVRVEFSFKGEDYDLTSHIDFDIRSPVELDNLSPYRILAREHSIDSISYLYEVMQEAEIEFGNAQGQAADFLREGCFDVAGFNRYWQEQKVVRLLQPIAQRSYLSWQNNHFTAAQFLVRMQLEIERPIPIW